MEVTQKTASEVFDKFETFRAEIVRDHGISIIPIITASFDIKPATDKAKEDSKKLIGEKSPIIKLDN